MGEGTVSGKLSTAASLITIILVPLVGFFASRNIAQGERLSVVESGQPAIVEQVKLLRDEMRQMRTELRDDIKALGQRIDRRP